MNKTDGVKKLGLILRHTFADIMGLKFYATADGAIVEPDGGELKTGVKLNVKLPDGTMQPAPAGDIVMDDGTIVTVGADGIITEIKPKEESPAEDQEMAGQKPTATTQPKSVEQTTSTITMFTDEAKAELKAMFAEVIADEVDKRLATTVKAEKFETVESGIEAFKKEVADKLTAISEAVEKIGSEPSAQSFGEKPKKIGSESAHSKSKALQIAEAKLNQN